MSGLSAGLVPGLNRMRPAVRLEALALPIRQALERAGPLGARAILFEARGELTPAKLSGTGRRELAALARSRQLEIAGIACGLRRGLAHPDDLERRMDHVRQVIDLATDLGTNRVVLEAGPVGDPQSEDCSHLAGLLADLASVAVKRGVVLALPTGLESGADLAALLEKIDSEGVGAAFDPAAQITGGFAPTGDLADLANHLALVVAADGRRARAGRSAERLSVGAGEIDWLTMLENLRDTGYTGWLVVDGDNDNSDSACDGLVSLVRLMGLAGV